MKHISTEITEEELIAYLGTQSDNKIFIPKKVRVVLQKYIPAKELKSIHKDKKTAIELCLFVLSILVPTIYNNENDGWKNISRYTLHQLTKPDTSKTLVYHKIIKLLVRGSAEKGAIIEVNNSYKVGQKTKSYRLTSTYRVGSETYDVKTEYLKKRMRNNRLQKLIEASQNVIGMNCLKLQLTVDMPTEDQIISHARQLVKEGYVTPKGKKLTFRNGHTNDYWADSDQRSFVEDNIEWFNVLTKEGFMVPIIGEAKSGGRVVDSFTLMPSWIRSLILIDGEQIQGRDFSALHPNLANLIYGDNKESITHTQVAEYLGIDRRLAKVEHLSFFNKDVWAMKKSPLWKYYEDNHKNLLDNVVDQKNAKGYKITSQELLNAEVGLMTEVIDELNQQGIFPIYVYDALYFRSDMMSEIENVMRSVAKRFGVNTNI